MAGRLTMQFWKYKNNSLSQISHKNCRCLTISLLFFGSNFAYDMRTNIH